MNSSPQATPVPAPALAPAPAPALAPKETAGNVRIVVYKSVDWPQLDQLFCERQRAALKAHAVTSTSLDESLGSRPGSYMFLALDAHERPIAGMRLVRSGTDTIIPLLRALRAIDRREAAPVEASINAHSAEACSWWVEPEGRGLGLPAMLMRASIVLAPALGVTCIWAFPHQWTRSICEGCGFRPLMTVGSRGEFVYPDERYVSTVMYRECGELATTRDRHADPRRPIGGSPHEEHTRSAGPRRDASSTRSRRKRSNHGSSTAH